MGGNNNEALWWKQQQNFLIEACNKKTQEVTTYRTPGKSLLPNTEALLLLLDVEKGKLRA